jgi:hypothetical protein
MSIVLRFVDQTNIVREHFIGFVRLRQFDARALANELIKFLKQYNIDPSACVAQCYDGYLSYLLRTENRLLILNLFLFLQSICYVWTN